MICQFLHLNGTIMLDAVLGSEEEWRLRLHRLRHEKCNVSCNKDVISDNLVSEPHCCNTTEYNRQTVGKRGEEGKRTRGEIELFSRGRGTA